MGRANIRLNPRVTSATKRVLLKQATMLLWSVAGLLPVKDQPHKRGPKPYDYRIIMVLCILRILLRKTYDDYEIEMRTDPRLLKWLHMKKLPSKSTLHRGMETFTMNFWRQFNIALVKPWLKEKPDLLLDSSGIRIIGKSIWFCMRVKKKISRRDCDKTHIAICNDKLLVVNWFLSNSKRNDSPYFRKLLKPFKKLGIVLADKGYCARKNFQYAADKAGAAFIKLKKGVTAKPKRCQAWKAAVNLCKTFPLLYKTIYNQRSRVEAAFSALKRRYGDQLYSRKWRLRRREFAMRLIAYNVRIILYATYAKKHNLPLWVRA